MNENTTDWLTKGISEKKLKKEKEKALKAFDRIRKKNKIYKISYTILRPDRPINTFIPARNLSKALKIFHKQHRLSTVNIVNIQEYNGDTKTIYD